MLDSLTSWLVLIGVLVLLFGGSTKIPEVAKALGRAVGEFKKGQAEIERELHTMTEPHASQPSSNASASNTSKPNQQNKSD